MAQRAENIFPLPCPSAVPKLPPKESSQMTESTGSQERCRQLVDTMVHRAGILWKEEDVDNLRSAIEQVAQRLQQIENSPPPSEVEPGFFLI